MVGLSVGVATRISEYETVSISPGLCSPYFLARLAGLLAYVYEIFIENGLIIFVNLTSDYRKYARIS